MANYLTLTDAGKILGVSRQQIKKYIDSGRIKAVLIAGRLVIDKRNCKKPRARRPGPKPLT